MDAADEQWRLAMLILSISLDSAADQEFDNVLLLTSACDMQRCSQLGIDQIWLGPGPLEQEHEHLSKAQLGRLVQHGLPLGIVHVLLFNLVESQETLGCCDVVVFYGVPKRLVHAVAIFLEV